ncbi:MAG: class I SAM-dependent methyltransferase [bacterium]|nr:class I SAM-dependent methyltransferase [bacterium]
MKNVHLHIKYGNGRHWDNHPRTYAEDFANFLRLREFDDLIVDLGCGAGHDVAVFTENGFKTIGIDRSQDETIAARLVHPNLKFDQQNGEALSFDDNSVGAFFCINLMHYVNQTKILAEISRALKPCGYLFVHFNLSIIDHTGKVDFEQSAQEILINLKDLRPVRFKIVQRIDNTPIPHEHKIFELVMQKPLPEKRKKIIAIYN